MFHVTFTRNGEVFSHKYSNNGDLFSALREAAISSSKKWQIKDVKFETVNNGILYVSKYCTKASVTVNDVETFYYENGVFCYGQVREDSNYEVKCENEEDDWFLYGTDWTSWSDAVEWVKSRDEKIVEIESDL